MKRVIRVPDHPRLRFSNHLGISPFSNQPPPIEHIIKILAVEHRPEIVVG